MRPALRLVESPRQTINTSNVGRSNLNWRLWGAHLSRKAPTAARSIRWLKAKFSICVASYNLIRAHETLSRGPDRLYRAINPALAARVTDHQWTYSEMLAYPAPCQLNGDLDRFFSDYETLNSNITS